MNSNHEKYMRHCLALAGQALQAGDPPVGAIVVFDDRIVGEGIESGKTTGDITNHAEILAIKDAINNGYRDKLRLSVMFTTHEPCVMCAYVIRHHHLKEIIYGTAVPFIGGVTSQFSLLTTQDVPKWGEKPRYYFWYL